MAESTGGEALDHQTLTWYLFKMHKVMQNDKKATKIISNRAISSCSNRKKRFCPFRPKCFRPRHSLKEARNPEMPNSGVYSITWYFKKSIFSLDQIDFPSWDHKIHPIPCKSLMSGFESKWNGLARHFRINLRRDLKLIPTRGRSPLLNQQPIAF